ncbi:hypothetical protein C8F04DRAFT_1182859 [Mycena alexandri]|uniref:Uncharacterized protein n=1 Tax=Mycena alexandri TaxID=1745969 RepID=A0AAD6SZZ7_9AGAR|nr:hypothetical protein C8F04DRAFT_1182859 [Mycena alexandri]
MPFPGFFSLASPASVQPQGFRFTKCLSGQPLFALQRLLNPRSISVDVVGSMAASLFTLQHFDGVSLHQPHHGPRVSSPAHDYEAARRTGECKGTEPRTCERKGERWYADKERSARREGRRWDASAEARAVTPPRTALILHPCGADFFAPSISKARCPGTLSAPAPSRNGHLLESESVAEAYQIRPQTGSRRNGQSSQGVLQHNASCVYTSPPTNEYAHGSISQRPADIKESISAVREFVRENEGESW